MYKERRLHYATDQTYYIFEKHKRDFRNLPCENGAYEAMLQANELDAAIAEAKFASEGKLIDAREALSSLRRKDFG